ncbi:hypothetical protein AB1N83_010615 [Pleurotus pulmonarius]
MEGYPETGHYVAEVVRGRPLNPSSTKPYSFPGWTTAIAYKVRQQAIYSHLKGEEKMCHDLKHSFSDSLTLNGVTRPLIKVADQGNTAITYKVGAGGWPDPSVKKDVTAYTKSGKI